uniref:Uncharacterized protein n=1 Tax=Ixodes ricinus TaxID=34613 RepID=A0A6B0U9G5_IXORI
MTERTGCFLNAILNCKTKKKKRITVFVLGIHHLEAFNSVSSSTTGRFGRFPPCAKKKKKMFSLRFLPIMTHQLTQISTLFFFFTHE